MRSARAAGDLAAAVTHAARAHAAWPGQWVYAYGLASVAALAGNAGEVQRGLWDLRGLGAAPDLSADTTLVRFARQQVPWMLEPFEQFEQSGRSMGRGEVAFRFPAADSAFWPEGLAYDGTHGDYFVTGVREGRIVRVDSTGRVHPFARVANSGWAALGVAVDPARAQVWVGTAALPQAAGYATADSGRGAVLAFDRATGREVARFDLPPAPEGHVPGDVVVTPGGDVFVSDSGQPVIWRIRGGKLEAFARDPGFRSLQGQALDPDGSSLYVADYSHGIAVVDLETRAVTWVRPREDESTLGIDGLVWHPMGSLVAVQNGIVPPRVVQLGVERRGRNPHLTSIMAVARDPEQADEPTLLAIVKTANSLRTVYIANSQWEKYDEAGRRRPGTRLVPPLGLFAPVWGDGPLPPEVSPTRWRPLGGSGR